MKTILVNPLRYKGVLLADNNLRQVMSLLNYLVKENGIPEWKFEANSADTPPIGPVLSEESEEDNVLVPYGSARLRGGKILILKK